MFDVCAEVQQQPSLSELLRVRRELDEQIKLRQDAEKSTAIALIEPVR
jgi:hypothetical protein